MWHQVAKCNHCDEIACEWEFSSKFLQPICSECGRENDFRKVVARFAFTGSKLKPWTWLKYEWIER